MAMTSGSGTTRKLVAKNLYTRQHSVVSSISRVQAFLTTLTSFSELVHFKKISRLLQERKLHSKIQHGSIKGASASLTLEAFAKIPAAIIVFPDFITS